MPDAGPDDDNNNDDNNDDDNDNNDDDNDDDNNDNYDDNNDNDVRFDGGDERFDVQRRSPFTPEGQIESAGRFARGLGAERMRGYIARAFVAFLVLAVLLVIAEIFG